MPTAAADQNALRRHIVWGAFGWCLFSLIAVAARGVRWDETYEAALIMTGAAPYPAGHPIYLYFRGLFSAQNFFSAAWLFISDHPLAICGFKNALFLSFVVLPPFVLTAVLTRRARWGHAAAALVLMGGSAAFQSYYPVNVWPAFFSVGPIGMGWVLLLLPLFVAGCRRTAWLMLGLLPAIHLGQAPAAFMWAGIAVMTAWWTRVESGPLRDAAKWGGAGLAFSTACFLLHGVFRVAPPVSGTYAVSGDAQAIWAAYTALHDVHRAFPRFGPFGHSVTAMTGFLLLSGLGAYEELIQKSARRPFAWLLLYGACVSALVFGIMLIQTILATNTPFLLIGWMPYRLTNHLAMLLLPMALALAVRSRGCPEEDSLQYPLIGLLAIAAFWPVWAAVLPAGWYGRYFQSADALVLCLAGMAAAAALCRIRKHNRRAAYGVFALLGAGCAVLLLYHQLWAACAMLGIAVGILHGRWPLRLRGAKRIERTLVTVLCIAILLGLLYQQIQTREHLPRTQFQQRVTQYLNDNGESRAVLLTPYWNIEWTGRTRHPVMADYQTAHLMSYMPSLAPALKKMFADLYGLDVESASWPLLEPWVNRSVDEWRELACRYGFSYIVAPAQYPLKLTPVLRGEDHVLYAIQ